MRLFIAIVAAIVVWVAMFVGLVAGCAGVAWIFVFGDNPWPAWSGTVLMLIPAAGALLGAVAVFRSVLNWKPAR
jgi:hypothetical protein